ncbi:DUF1906 domain-containing protein [Microbacterium sp. CFH 31415]|uniref:glycoside hydrolase domain-containing protein n=1 Tax=Microbacterium sp. CFH 31415 TaxID=2921732 RepID=UPI001F1325A9|nr:glycoside hydrolase domain-containing protein [Microbacterium sp. CFH 31415]MCH6230562.1 DUF1906 domain-containing protein [Microbacterium sp. CFH 31415]
MSDPWVLATQQWYNVEYNTSLGPMLSEDGQPGWATMFALTRALQHELGLTALSDNFGSGTLAALTAFGDVTPSNPGSQPSNIVRIAQGALYCKGYNSDNGALSGVLNSTSQSAIRSLRTDMGLAAGSGVISPKVFKALLAMDATKLVAGGDSVIRQAQQALNGRYLHRRDFYAIPTDGYFLRETHRALLFAVQYEVGLADGVANGNFGPATKSGLQQQANLVVGSTDSTKFFVHLFQMAMRVNGYAVPFDGYFSTAMSTMVSGFQQFAALPQTGTGNLQTWASLLVSTGDPDRPGTGADCVTTLTTEKLATLRNAGYMYFGRYLTNTPDYGLDKCIKEGELQRILNSGGRLFPLFQTGGGQIGHFNYKRGEQVGEEAANAAWAYRLPDNAIIYFSVDFDALPYQVTDSVIPYFQGVHQRIGRTGRNYRVGVYGPRDVCTMIVDAGLAVSSFVSDMSTGYAGNLGHPLPANWAFDQIQTTTLGSGSGAIQIDKNVVSGRDTGVASLAPAIGVGSDPRIPAAQLDAFEAEWFLECYEHEDSPFQQAQMVINRPFVKARVAAHDAYITALAQEFNCYKALIMTPLIWEGMVIRADDEVADELVRLHYGALEAGNTPPEFGPDDSSTGVCQIFGRTGIRAINFGRNVGLISARQYDPSRWQDVWEVWQRLSTDEEFCIRVAAINMILEAGRPGGVTSTQLRSMTPSQVMAMCVGYNDSFYDSGQGESGMIYGRNRMQLYYAIQR